jgi:hypothetical protein
MVPTLSSSWPGYSRPPAEPPTNVNPVAAITTTTAATEPGLMRAQARRHSLTGANAASAGSIRRCYKCRRIGHDAEGCRTVVASIPADSAFRALLDSGHLAIFIVEGTLLHRRGHTG